MFVCGGREGGYQCNDAISPANAAPAEHRRVDVCGGARGPRLSAYEGHDSHHSRLRKRKRRRRRRRRRKRKRRRMCVMRVDCKITGVMREGCV